MVHMGDVDALVAGVTQHFRNTIRPALQIVRVREGLHRISGCYPIVTRTGSLYFLADTSPPPRTWWKSPCAPRKPRAAFDLVPRMAVLSFSSFGNKDLASSRVTGLS